MVGHINAAVTMLYALPTATVAAVNGHAIGGAFVLMLACDVRLAVDADARLPPSRGGGLVRARDDAAAAGRRPRLRVIVARGDDPMLERWLG